MQLLPSVEPPLLANAVRVLRPGSRPEAANRTNNALPDVLGHGRCQPSKRTLPQSCLKVPSPPALNTTVFLGQAALTLHPLEIMGTAPVDGMTDARGLGGAGRDVARAEDSGKILRLVFHGHYVVQQPENLVLLVYGFSTTFRLGVPPTPPRTPCRAHFAAPTSTNTRCPRRGCAL